MKAIIITLIVTVGAVTALSNWSNDHDAKVIQAAEAYEKCVSQQYHTTPATWYADHGEYPICQN